MTTSDNSTDQATFGVGSRMARLCAQKDWTNTPLGDPEGWPGTLRTAVRMVLDTRLPMTLVWGSDFIQIYNDGYVDILGDKHPAALGRPVEEIYSEAWDEIGPMLEKVFQTGEPEWHEDLYLPLERHGFLEELYFTFSYSPIRAPDGEIVGILSAAVDTTAHVLARRRTDVLRRLNQRAGDSSVREVLEESLSTLDEDAADLPVCVLYEHRPLDGSLELAGSTGVDPVTLPDGATLRELLPSELSDMDDALQELPRDVLGEVELIDDSRPGVGSAVCIPLWDRHGEGRQCVACLVIGLSEQLALDRQYRKFIVDVGAALSEQVGQIRYQELQVASAERRYEAVFDNSLDAMMLTAPDGRILTANPAACELLGYTEEEFREMGRTGLFDTDDERLEDAVRTRAETGYFRGQLNFIHRDGHVIPCEVSSQIYLDAEGNQRTSIVIRDQRERLALESNLRQAQKLDVVGKLAGGIAHDFNNLLMAIDASAQFLADVIEPGSEAAEDVMVIQAASDRAAALTQRLLAFSRQQPVRSSYLDLTNVISDIDAVLRSLLSENIEIVTHLEPNSGKVYASKQGIDQILLNLVVNARDAMQRGGTLTIELTNETIEEPRSCVLGDLEPGSWVRITVSDTGAGLPAGDPEQLFEPFFTTKEHGTGLGLATVASIVKDCAGAIDVYSEPGAGTRFDVYLPATHAPEYSEDLGDEPSESEASVVSAGRVLVVEDQALVRKVTCRMLEDAGYEVTAVSGGGEAIRAVEDAGAGSYDLVISDVVMPNMGGEETVLRLQELDPDLHILFMTGYAENSSLDTSSQDVRVLHKPFSRKRLLRCVERVLSEG